MNFVLTYNPEILGPEIKAKVLDIIHNNYSHALVTLHNNRSQNVAARFDRTDDEPTNEFLDVFENIINNHWTTPIGDEDEQGS